MNFTEIHTEVLRITKRPDKTVEAATAINRVVSFLTLKGNFAQDLIESSIAVDPTSYGATVTLVGLTGLTRFRKFKYIKPTGRRYYLEPLSAEKVLTPKGNVQPNVYYVSGTSLTYTLSELIATLQVGYYSYAPTLDATVLPTHWMFDIMPYAIIDLAAAKVFMDTGDEAAARLSTATGMEFFLAARRDLQEHE